METIESRVPGAGNFGAFLFIRAMPLHEVHVLINFSRQHACRIVGVFSSFKDAERAAESFVRRDERPEEWTTVRPGAWERAAIPADDRLGIETYGDPPLHLCPYISP